MARFPSLPLFVDAYLADTAHLTDTEHGRYLMLLMHMWRSPECRLPDDDEWLAKHFHRSVEDVRKELRPIISEFMRTHGGWVIQHRLLREWSWVKQRRHQTSQAAKSRWRNKKGSSERIQTADAGAYPNAYAPNPRKSKSSFGTTSERPPPVDNSKLRASPELIENELKRRPRPPSSLATAHLDSALPRSADTAAELPSEASKPNGGSNPERPFSRKEAGKPEGWDLGPPRKPAKVDFAEFLDKPGKVA